MLNEVIGFFFSSRRRHTRCYRDWSSDVCSSDLVRHAARLEDVEPLEHLDALAHEEDESRRGLGEPGDLLWGPQDDLEPFCLEVLAREPEDLGVVGLAARRVRRLAKDAPAERVLHP